MNSTVLEVSDLVVEYPTANGTLRAVDHVSLTVGRGERVGIVGESGSGKSTLALAVMRLLRPPGIVGCGSVRLLGHDLLRLQDEEMRRLRGSSIAMVYQDPFTFLNPVMRVGDQVAESILVHGKRTERQARGDVIELFRELRLPRAETLYSAYPHQLSGGQRQRVVIAMAIAMRPAVLIADEPTTALDVTVQAQILRLLARLADELGLSLVLISHDLQVVRSVCDRIYVMYAGEVVEDGDAARVLGSTRHPYTAALMEAGARLRGPRERFSVIPGEPPDLTRLPGGCRFAARCRHRMPACDQAPPIVTTDAHSARCWLAQRESSS